MPNVLIFNDNSGNILREKNLKRLKGVSTLKCLLIDFDGHFYTYACLTFHSLQTSVVKFALNRAKIEKDSSLAS